MSTPILVVLGHPSGESFCAALARTYVEAARSSGHEVRLLALGEMTFDPILRHGYRCIQPLEPDLAAAQEAILRAEHLVFVFPLWWGSMPALLKGFFDRAWLPGFAYQFRDRSPFWDKLLTGRSAHLLVTMDTPPWYHRWVAGRPGLRQMEQAILEFSGIEPVRCTELGPMKRSSPEQRRRWLEQAAEMARSFRGWRRKNLAREQR